jgi:hypothetical protein
VEGHGLVHLVVKVGLLHGLREAIHHQSVVEVDGQELRSLVLLPFDGLGALVRWLLKVVMEVIVRCWWWWWWGGGWGGGWGGEVVIEVVMTIEVVRQRSGGRFEMIREEEEIEMRHRE